MPKKTGDISKKMHCRIFILPFKKPYLLTKVLTKKLVGFSLLKPIFSGCAFSEFVIIARQNRFHTKGTRNQPVSGNQKKELESYAGSEKIGIPLTNGHSSSIPSHM